MKINAHHKTGRKFDILKYRAKKIRTRQPKITIGRFIANEKNEF